MARKEEFNKYTSGEMHQILCNKFYKGDLGDWWDLLPEGDRWQPDAMSCPYYANLEGTLGSDWGVILNPASEKFGQLVFEHDWCGCKANSHTVGNQEPDQWIKK